MILIAHRLWDRSAGSLLLRYVVDRRSRCSLGILNCLGSCLNSRRRCIGRILCDRCSTCLVTATYHIRYLDGCLRLSRYTVDLITAAYYIRSLRGNLRLSRCTVLVTAA